MNTQEDILGPDDKLPNEGKCYVSVMSRVGCDICGEPATRKYAWLLKNPRSNPRSSGYGKDDIRWCEDAKSFYCEPCKDQARAPDGYQDGASIFPCTKGFAHMFLEMRSEKQS